MYKARTHYQADTVVEGYEAQRFRSLRGRWVDWLEKQGAVQAFVGLRPSSLILDVPVGTGRIAAALEQAGWRVMGADISAAMLQQSRNRHAAQTGLARADVEHLPFKDGAFDGAVSYRLMAHLPGPTRQAMLRELARVVRGPIVINYHLSRTSMLWAVNRLVRRSALAAYPVTADDVRVEVETCDLHIVAVRPLLLGVLDSYLYVLQR